MIGITGLNSLFSRDHIEKSAEEDHHGGEHGDKHLRYSPGEFEVKAGEDGGYRAVEDGVCENIAGALCTAGYAYAEGVGELRLPVYQLLGDMIEI